MALQNTNPFAVIGFCLVAIVAAPFWIAAGVILLPFRILGRKRKDEEQ